MVDSTEPRRIAIACQGGGSHTAFTAGVLKRLFGSAELNRFEVVGLSGTSGGAVCALLAWRALVDGAPERVGPALQQFWADNSAATPWQRLLNSLVIGASALQSVGAAPAVSPYDSPVAALDHFRALLESQLDFDKIEVDRIGQWPLLLVGAVDVLSGDFRAFHSRRDLITADVVLASAAIPNLFPAVNTAGGTYWDGLFSQNPPVRELVETQPDEIWVIQINPKARDTEPRSVVEILDRRNELAGNLSLYQELHHIEEINRLIDDGRLAPGGRHRRVVIRVIELSRSRLSGLLGPASKLNRDPGFIEELIAEGEQQAAEFLTALAFEEAWARRDAAGVAGFFADGAVAHSAAPFPERRAVGGPAELEVFLQAHFDSGVCMDLNRKQVSRDRVIWTARGVLGGGRPDLGWGRCEVLFRGGKVVELYLGAVD